MYMSLACILVSDNLMFQPKKNYYQNPKIFYLRDNNKNNLFIVMHRSKYFIFSKGNSWSKASQVF